MPLVRMLDALRGVRSEGSAAAPATPSFVLEHDNGTDLRIAGRLSLADAEPLWSALRVHAATLMKGDALNFDMAKVESVDGGALALLVGDALRQAVTQIADEVTESLAARRASSP